MRRAADRPWTLAHRVAALVGATLAIGFGWDGGARAVERGADATLAPSIDRGTKHRFLVHFEDVVRNEGTEPLRNVHCDLLLPVDDGRQTVRWLRLSPHAWRVRTDVHGERVASASVAALAPGDATTFSWIASVEIAEERHAPDVAATRAPPPPDVRRYLADGPLFRLSSDAVRAAADGVRRAASDGSPLAIVRAAAAYVRGHVDYVCEGGWDAAPTVLARGTGSCTEATYAFVAICRRLGVPARWIGGTMRRRVPSGRDLDTMFHRMAEVWIPGHGWLPVEPTRGRAGGSGVGRISGAMLQLAAATARETPARAPPPTSRAIAGRPARTGGPRDRQGRLSRDLAAGHRRRARHHGCSPRARRRGARAGRARGDPRVRREGLRSRARRIRRPDRRRRNAERPAQARRRADAPRLGRARGRPSPRGSRADRSRGGHGARSVGLRRGARDGGRAPPREGRLVVRGLVDAKRASGAAPEPRSASAGGHDPPVGTDGRRAPGPGTCVRRPHPLRDPRAGRPTVVGRRTGRRTTARV